MITDTDAKEHVSANIRASLEALELSVYWLRKQLDVGEGTIYPIVRGAVLPSVAMTARIAEKLGVTIDHLLLPPEEFTPPRKKSRKIA